MLLSIIVMSKHLSEPLKTVPQYNSQSCLTTLSVGADVEQDMHDIEKRTAHAIYNKLK